VTAGDGLFLGVDVGTSATRVSLVRPDGSGVTASTVTASTVIARTVTASTVTASAGYRTVRGADGQVEQDPAAWSRALATALRRVSLALGDDADLRAVTAVGLCGQTPTLVPVDAAGRPVRAALTWQDIRATAEAAELAERFGDPEPLIGTALPWSAANLPAKLAWLARHEPDTVRRTRWLLQPKDFTGMQLTGGPASDPWSSKGICRVDDGAPAAEVLAACGWPEQACPPIAAAWSPRGTVTAAAARRFGLPAGIPVCVGWSDALVQTLAAGCYERHSGFVFSGTSAIVGALASGKADGLFGVPASCAPAPLLYGPTQSSGACVAWVARLLGCRPADVPVLAAGACSGGPDGRGLGRGLGELPAFVPYLSGERAPLWNSEVRGLLLGLAAEHGPAEIARAVMAGTLLSARHVLDVVEGATGAPVTEIEFAGRGAGDANWQAVALETLGARVRFHSDPDLSARGAAMLAAVMTGFSFEQASAALVDATRTAAPSAAQVSLGRRLSARYRRASETALAWLEASGGGEVGG
jgi:xylulokinase